MSLIRKIPEVRRKQPVTARETNRWRHQIAQHELSDVAGIDRHIMPGGTTLITRGKRLSGSCSNLTSHAHSDTWDGGFALGGFTGPD